MRVAVLGAGAVGCGYGYLLSQAGNDVVLIDVWEEHVAQITQHGLRVEGGAEHPPLARIEASTDAGAARGADAVIVLVKAFASQTAARAVQPALGPETIVVTLQNGVGNDARLADVLGPDPVVQGSTTVAARMKGPGHVALAPTTLAGKSLTVMGRPRSKPHAHVCDQLAAALTASSLPAQVLDDVSAVVWRKAAMAATIGPLCAIVGCTVADAIEREPLRAILERGFAETMAVAAAEGVRLDPAEVWAHALDTYQLVGPHPPSLTVDVTRGRPSEIEAQLGEVQRRGQAAGVPTPVSDVLVTVIRAWSSEAAGIN